MRRLVSPCAVLSLLPVLVFAACAVFSGEAERRHTLASPNGRLTVVIELPEPDTDDRPRWSASFDGAPLFAASTLGLLTEAGTDLLAGVRCVDRTETQRDQPVDLLFTKTATTRDRHGELQLALHRQDGTKVRVVVRCYDDALAFRYVVEACAGAEELRLRDDSTAFVLAADAICQARCLPHFRTSHEHEVTTVAANALPAGQLLDTPLTAQWPDGRVVAITEAALRRFAGMSLRADGRGGLRAALSPGENGPAVVRALPATTPWRVVLLGDRPGALLESNTLQCLNEPPAFDTSWIRPGKLTWPWWNGYLFEAERGDPILSLAANRRHIDWCAENGIDFHAVVADENDSPWYVQGKEGLFPGPDTDATKVRPDLDLPAIVAHAQARGVRLWTWVHHGAMRGRVDAVVAAMAAHGFRGVMVDFLDRDDQATVEFCEDVLTAAAEHRVLVHFHGMHKPTGTERTFPHLMNHEGSLNLEYLKWSDRCTPEHTLRVVFTRLVAGPMDYHLGGFRAVRADAFAPKHVAPVVLGTRAHHLAMYVCIDNAAPMVADYPAAYRDEPGFEFVREVPTWWHETRVLDAHIGSALVTARRRDAVWWVGGLFAGASREVSVPLAFLGPGRHTLQLWRDGEQAATDPDDLERERREVTAADVVRVRIAAGGGGFVMRIE